MRQATEAQSIFGQLKRWFPPRSSVLISSNEPPSFFASEAAASPHRVFLAHNFSSLIAKAASVSNNNVLFALEILLQQGAATHVETFQGDALKARLVCALFRLLEERAATSCDGRGAGTVVERGGAGLLIKLECSSTS